MAVETLIRSWKDEDYYNSLAEWERDLVPRNPAGAVEVPAFEVPYGPQMSDTWNAACSFSLLSSCGIGTWGCC